MPLQPSINSSARRNWDIVRKPNDVEIQCKPIHQKSQALKYSSACKADTEKPGEGKTASKPVRQLAMHTTGVRGESVCEADRSRKPLDPHNDIETDGI